MSTTKKNSTSGNRNAWIVGGVIAAVIAIAAIVAISASSKKTRPLLDHYKNLVKSR